jgi:hypothetical protein
MNYMAKDVLADYFEFTSLEPSKTSWNQKKLKSNPPRFYRLKILKSLFKAFNLGNIKEFEEGGFILKRDIEDYKALIKQIRSDPSVKKGLRADEDVTLKHICRIFERLLRYRSILDEALRFNSGLLTARGIYSYPYKRIDRMNEPINNNISIIDDILCLIISPAEKTISRKELIMNFDYPQVNVIDIDADCF